MVNISERISVSSLAAAVFVCFLILLVVQHADARYRCIHCSTIPPEQVSYYIFSLVYTPLILELTVMRS